jgi:hypothetical protein
LYYEGRLAAQAMDDSVESWQMLEVLARTLNKHRVVLKGREERR